MSGSATVFAVATYSGQQTSAAIAIDDTSTQIQVGLDRSSATLWSSSSTSALVEVFLNGAFDFSFTVSAKDKNNPKDTGDTGLVVVDLPSTTGRQMTVRLTVSGGFVHTSVSAQWQ